MRTYVAFACLLVGGCASGGSGSTPVDGGATTDSGGSGPVIVADTGISLPPIGTSSSTGLASATGVTTATGVSSGTPSTSSVGSGETDAGATSSATTSAATSSTSASTGGVPTTCGEADNAIGCCVGTTRYYCTSGGTLKADDCSTNATNNVCGWSATYNNYGCVTTAGSDPSGTYPLTCGGGGGSTSGSTTTTASSTSTSTSSAPTWTYLYTTYLAEGSTIGDCDGSCHHHSECSSASACFNWIGNDIQRLSWEGGNMPPGGPSSDAQAEADFAAWQAAGGQDN